MNEEATHPRQIIVNEIQRLGKEDRLALSNIIDKQGGFGIGSFITLHPEERKEYGPDMSASDVYKEVARIVHRSSNLFARMDQGYLESVLPLYDSLIPLIEDQEVKGFTEYMKKVVIEDLKRHQDFNIEIKNLRKTI